jgi:hypothetical protein
MSGLAVSRHRATPVPSPKAVRDVLFELLGRDVEVRPGDPVVPTLRRSACVAVYVDDATKLQAVASFDLPLTAYAGAALGLVPAAGAQQAVDEGDVPASLVENVGEVLNIMASLFNTPDAPHLRMHTTTAPGTQPPADVVVLTRALGRRLDLEVEVADYGTGGLSIVLA